MRLGLYFDFAQLAAQAKYAFREVKQRGFESAHFAFDARAGNGDFARFVKPLVNQISAHAQGRMHHGGWRQGRCSSQWRFLYWRRRGFCQHVGWRIAQRIDQERDAVKRCFQCIKVFRCYGHGRHGCFDAGLHVMQHLAAYHRAGHACAAFQGMQRACQRLRYCAIVGRCPPGAQMLADVTHQINAFVKEQWQQLRVDFVFKAHWVGFLCGGSMPCGRVHRRHRIECGGKFRLLAGHAPFGDSAEHAGQRPSAAGESKAMRFAGRGVHLRKAHQRGFQRMRQMMDRKKSGRGGNAGRGVRRADGVVTGHAFLAKPCLQYREVAAGFFKVQVVERRRDIDIANAHGGWFREGEEFG